MTKRPAAPARLAAALLTSILPSCGAPDGAYRLEVYPARGTVTYRGEPVVGATIAFHPVDPETTAVPEGRGPEVGSPIAHVGEGGVFKMSTYLADDGVPAGAYVVTVTWPTPARRKGQASAEATAADPNDPSLADEASAPDASRMVDRLGGKYGDKVRSPLRAKVTSEGPNLFEFKLD